VQNPSLSPWRGSRTCNCESFTSVQGLMALDSFTPSSKGGVKGQTPVHFINRTFGVLRRTPPGGRPKLCLPDVC
jgi:hypothetical protein